MANNYDQKNYRAPVPTGGYLVKMRQNMRTSSAVKQLKSLCSMDFAVSSDFGKQSSGKKTPKDNTAVLLEHLNVAVIRSTEKEFSSSMMSRMKEHDDISSVRPEFHMFAIGRKQDRYENWVREGLQILADGFPRGSIAGRASAMSVVSAQENDTWGLQAIRADKSTRTGRGIKIAVLDTGFDMQHPDFQNRNITTRSFVSGETVQDVDGHGTHCIGTAAGPLAPDGSIRYGVAHEAEIFVGKVLGNDGNGFESDILEGMDWAIGEKCEVISMSLGRPTSPGESFDPIYESVGETALESGSLIIAAAGNESARQFKFVAPVSAPANSPSIMAVGAIDVAFDIANFSCGGINPDGGEVNLVGPGVDILSTVPMPKHYARFPGTSMACPHVAGVAALLAQGDSSLRGSALWDALRRTALDLGLPISDGGAGLVQAPVDGSVEFS